MTSSLFLFDIEVQDDLYKVIRDENRCEDLKTYAEELWGIYSQYSDPDFRQQLAQDFRARFWEMDLTCKLLDLSFNVRPKNDSFGPDIRIIDSSRSIFIEAVTPSVGAETNPDQVPEIIPNTGVAVRVPDIEIMLRYSGAIYDKHKKYLDYLEKGLITSNDAYIIALNSCKISDAIDDMNNPSDLPRIVKTVLPIGPKQVFPGKDSNNDALPWRYQNRPSVTRSSGSEITTNIFLIDEYSGISGLLYSHSDVENRWNDFIFVHNPKAKNSIPKGYFQLGTEFHVELETDRFYITWDDWR